MSFFRIRILPLIPRLPHLICHIYATLCIQGAKYLWCQRLSARLALKIAPKGERGRKGRECKFPNKAHRTFDIINTYPPVHLTDTWKHLVFISGRYFCWLATTKTVYGRHGPQLSYKMAQTFVDVCAGGHAERENKVAGEEIWMRRMERREEWLLQFGKENGELEFVLGGKGPLPTFTSQLTTRIRDGDRWSIGCNGPWNERLIGRGV